MPGVSLPCVLGPAACDYVTPELDQFTEAKSLLDTHMTFAHTQPTQTEADPDTSWSLERIPGAEDLEPESFMLEDGQKVITLGRKKGNSRVCQGLKVSRHHASLIKRSGGWAIMDVGSTCGTFVNGELLETNKVRKLESGDTISLGTSDKTEAGSHHFRVVQPLVKDWEEQSEDTDDEGFADTPAASPDMQSEMPEEAECFTEYEPEFNDKKITVDNKPEENVVEEQVKVEIHEESKHIPVIRECFIRLVNFKEAEYEKEEDTFGCDLCDFSSNDSDSLDIHIREEHIEITYPCDECHYSASSKEKLETHVITIHENVEELKDSKMVPSKPVKSHYCDQCPHKARDATRLAMHKQTAHSDIEIKCDLCDFICKHKIFLKRHIHLMHEERKFVCQQCGRNFALQGTLNRHLRETHTNFVCDQCEFTSTNKETFKRHVDKLHLGIKYKCKQCDHESISQKARRAHERLVHENIKYPCHICDHVSNNKCNLMKHLERPDHGGRGTNWRLKEMGKKQKNYHKTKHT